MNILIYILAGIGAAVVLTAILFLIMVAVAKWQTSKHANRILQELREKDGW